MNATTTPHCYILDERFRLLLAGPSSETDPFTPLYDPSSAIDALPPVIETAVRQMTAVWTQHSAGSALSTVVGDWRISVAPLHGSGGRHIGVFVGAA